MKKKLFALAFFVGLVALLEACFCPCTSPYFDYHKLKVSYGTDFIGADTIQSFFVELDSVDYLASTYQLVLTPSAFGTQCPIDGEDGAKYAVTNFEIFADKDFNDTLPKGESLSKIFYSRFAADSMENILQTLQAFPFYPEAISVLHTPYHPTDTSQVFEITMRITKSNGSVAEGKVSGVKFN